MGINESQEELFYEVEGYLEQAESDLSYALTVLDEAFEAGEEGSVITIPGDVIELLEDISSKSTQTLLALFNMRQRA